MQGVEVDPCQGDGRPAYFFLMRMIATIAQ